MGTAARTPGYPEPDPAADGRLLEGVKQGVSAALDELYARYSSPIYSLIFRILRSPEETEDVALDVFWQIWRQAGRYDPSRGAPAAWIFTLARSRAIDRLRARRRREEKVISLDAPTFNLDPMDEKARPDEVASFRQGRDAVRQAMVHLSAVQREALEMAFFRGMTHLEIAKELGKPLGTIKTRVRQGLIRLRQELD